MNARRIIWAVVIGILAIICFLIFERRNATRFSQPVDAETNTALENGTPKGSMPPATNAVQTNEANSSAIVPSSSSNPPPSIAEAMDAYSKQLHQPIEFFGRVVDDRGAAVAGANVQFVWSHYISPEATFETNVLTDINGGFSLTGVVGATLGVHVSKPGYYRMGDASDKSFSYSRAAFQRPFQPDPGNPIVFQLRRKGAGVALVTSGQNMLPEYSVSLPRDDTPVRVDLLQRQISDTGQIQISQNKPDFKDWKQASQWGFKMVIPDGGFIEENDQFPFEAPESGYQPTVEFRFQKGQEDWKTDVKRDYYIEFGNPPKFGHLHIMTAIDINDVRLTYEINPDGSKNLEPQ